MRGTSHSLQAASDRSKPGAAFQSTLWSQVRAAGRLNDPEAKNALERLCCIYWNPIYTFLLRSGHDYQAAQDLTQEFFLYLLQENLLQKADQERGRFRSFLLGALKFFVSNAQALARSLKRGGRATFVTIDVDSSTDATLLTHLTPERMFERKWALTAIDQAIQRLEAEYRQAGMQEEFAALQPYLAGDP